MLSLRLAYVEDGKRQSDFTRWVKEHGATVFSLHGVDPMMDFAHPHELPLNETRKMAKRMAPSTRSDDPFSADRMNLDLSYDDPNSPPNCFPGNSIHLEDGNPPSLSQLLVRAVTLSLHFAPVLSTVGLAIVWKGFRERIWYRWLTNCIASSGAAWIKWGQWSSTRNDMFPDALCDQLAMLHSDAPAHSWSFSEQCLESSLGLAPGTLPLVFDEFEPAPIASGSIAQIHRAILDGRLVAVKIRHPRVAQLIDMDFRLMTILARGLDWIPALSWLHIRESVEQFSHTMAAQSFLHVEAHHLEVLGHNFRKWKHVRFPQPFYASSAVIMETFEPGRIVTSLIDLYNRLANVINEGGTPLNLEEMLEDNQLPPVVFKKIESIASSDESTGNFFGKQNEESGSGATDINGNNQLVQGYDLVPLDVAKFLVTTGLGVYLKMLLVDNLMHADLHPGNIMIDLHRGARRAWSQRDGRNMVPYDPVASSHSGFLGITLVDAGMVAQLTEEESAVFIGLLSSIGEGDGESAAKFALQFSLENNMDANEQAAFVDEMVKLFAERCRGYGTGVDVGHVLRGVLGLIRKHKVRIDANFATLVVNCLCIESLGRAFCPSYNVLDAARPLLQSYRRMCYNADGTPRPSAAKSKFVKLWLSLMYARKRRADNKFFKQQASGKA